MKEKKVWSRRQFSKAVISAQLLIASGALSLPLACADDKKLKTDVLLNDSEQETLKFAMDEIIPANNKMPSASDVGGVTYVLKILDELPKLIPLFEALIIQLNEQSKAKANDGFAKLKSKERIDILIHFEKAKPELFKVLKDFTYESYYTNDTVFNLIGYEPHPTGTMGPKMEPFNESLLDRVKNLPPMYTKI